MAKEFSIMEAATDQGAVVLRVTGRLDARNAQALLRKCRETEEKGNKNVVINLSEVSFVASSGVGTLLALTEEFADADGSVTLKVSAKLGDSAWGILQSPYMHDKARTVSFNHEITVKGNRLLYSQTTGLEIYGRSFDHTDANELARQE